MKKLVFMFVAVAAISFASCGNKTAATAEVADSDTVAVLDSAEAVLDSAAAVVDSAAAEVAEAADAVEEVAEEAAAE